MVLIPKDGKRDYSNPRAFRPISLTSFLFKGMERVVCWHLEEVGVVDRLSAHQHAFRKNHSTDTVLSEVVDIIEQNVLRKRHTLGVFFDIEGAFDNVLLDKVLEGLQAKGVRKEVIGWYGYYLKNRTATISLGNTTRTRALVRGTPQGGILSPLVWNIVFDSLLESLRLPGIHPRGYADDGMFLVSGPCPETLVDLAQPAINKAVAWGMANGLRFSTNKTQVILFSRSRNLKINKHLRINGEPIPFSNEVKYLGVTLTSQLRWDVHIKAKIKKARAKLVLLKMATGLLWGPSPRMMIWAYNSIVVPAVTYAAIVWGHVKFPQIILNSLDRLNRLALTGLAPIRSKTPTAGLEAILGVKPLELVIQEAGRAAYWRWRPRLTWAGCGTSLKERGHILSWVKMGTLVGGREPELNKSVITYNWDPPCISSSASMAKGSPKGCKISTSRVEHQTQFLISYFGDWGTGGLPELVTVTGRESNRSIMALEAVLKAMYEVLEQGQRVSIIMLSPPSKLFQPLITDLASRNLLQACTGVQEKTGNKVVFARAKGKSLTPVERYESIPGRTLELRAYQNFSDVRDKIRCWGSRLWQERWEQTPKCTQTKIWVPSVGAPDTFGYFRTLPRADLGKAIQLLTGHNGMRRHTAKFSKDQTGVECRLCGEEEEDASHLWARCPAMVFEGWDPLLLGKVLFLNSTPLNRLGDRPLVWTRSQLSRFLRVPFIAGLLQPDRGH